MEVQTHDFLNNAGSKKEGEASNDALGLGLGWNGFDCRDPEKTTGVWICSASRGIPRSTERMGRQVKPLASVLTFIWHPAEQRLHLI